MSAPIVIVHRRNRIAQLSGLPPESWIEIDIDLKDGVPVLSHDPILKHELPPLVEDFLPRARENGVAGFVFDCKRENVEGAVAPLIAQHKIENYFFLNEMEVQGDLYLAENPAHRTAMRIWQYRGARDLIRYAEERRAAKLGAPAWAWIDCWHRDLTPDMARAHIPLTQTEAHQLQKLEVKLCLCSPELYVHDYEKKYTPAELEDMYRGIAAYRQRLLHAGIQANAICTKFPWLWTMEL